MSYLAYFNFGKYQRSHHAEHRGDHPPSAVVKVRSKSGEATVMDGPHCQQLRCLEASASGVTDAGHRNKQNQDAFFTLTQDEADAMVMGVFDGHGRDTGRDAATTARAFFEAQFRSYSPEQYARLEEEPHAVFTELFHACHCLIKTVFTRMYQQRGYIVQEDDGSLIRKDNDGDDEDAVCIRGGTTATIVVLLHGGSKIITANVGDSAALIGSSQAMLGVNDIRPCIRANAVRSMATASTTTRCFGDEIKSEYLLLTGNHSADNESEFLRVRKHSYGSPETQVQFVYDCAAKPSSRTGRKCQPVFNVSHRGLVQHNPVGDYFKNVRDEWATMVTTPVEAPYPEALAFTRSLGDFNLHNYGVCDEPTVNILELQDAVAQHLQRKANSSPDAVEAGKIYTDLYLVVASDGVWDNWKYEELVKFVVNQDDSTPSVVDNLAGFFLPSSPQNHDSKAQGEDPGSVSIDQLASRLMEANIERAQRIFGDQADNMTAIVCRLRFNIN